jgi:RNA polymerase sigma-70 factor (ECF subfamily)
MSESEVVARAQQGDLQAFEELYEAHKSRVYALSLRMVRDPGRAEEMTQDAFVRAWQKLASFQGRSSFSTWLHRLAANVILGRLRSEKRWSDRETDFEEIEARHGASETKRQEIEIDLERAISLLPSKARVVFILHDVEGYRHAEIAELAGIAEGTSKAHLHRARKLLREVLKQ